MESSKKGQEKKKIPEEQIFPVQFALGEIKEKIIITTTNAKPSNEQIINQAINFHLKGNIVQAIKFYQYLIEQGCKDQRVFSNYGIILKDLGKLQEAEIATRKAIELQPDFAISHLNLGSILEDSDKLEEAENSFRRAIKLQPDLAKAHSNLGRILIEFDKLKEAEISFRKAIELQPDFAKALSNLGRILIELGKSEEAEILIRKAIKLQPDQAESYQYLGIILRNKGAVDQAKICSERLMRIRPWSIIGEYSFNHSLKSTSSHT